MANRTNRTEPNRTGPCSVCSCSAPHRTEPNTTPVRFVFAKFGCLVIVPSSCAINTLRTDPSGRDVKIKLYWASVNIEAVQGRIFKHLYVIPCVPRLFLSSLTPFNVFPIRKESFSNTPNKLEPNRGSVRFGGNRTMPLFGSASNRTNRTNSNLHCSGSHL
jgi:hypothetical protein